MTGRTVTTTGNSKKHGHGNDRLLGKGGDDTLAAGPGNDRLYGQDGNDSLFGDAGNDKLSGGPGEDVLVGGAGNDQLRGETGHDWLYGDAGNDRLVGGSGNDKLSGGPGHDRLYGGAGDDLYFLGRGDGRDVIEEETGRFAGHWCGRKTKDGSGGNDVIRFGEGIGREDIVFAARHRDLVLQYGEGETAVIKGQLGRKGPAVERVELADGSYLTAAEINQVVQEMAAFAKDGGIPMTSASDVRQNPDLMQLVVNAWHA